MHRAPLPMQVNTRRRSPIIRGEARVQLFRAHGSWNIFGRWAGSPLRLVPIPQLIALKLYAGGYKSKADIVELLAHNPQLDLAEVRAVCKRYHLAGLDELIADAT